MTKIIEFKTGITIIGFLEIPNDATKFTFGECYIYYEGDCSKSLEIRTTINWRIIGLSSEISEEKFKYIFPIENTGGRYMYDDKRDFIDHPILSFKSLKNHLNIIDTNFYGEKPTETFNNPDWEWKRTKWSEAQKKVKKYLVLVRESF